MATITLPHMLPFGLHGSWTGEYLGPDPSQARPPTCHDIRSGVQRDTQAAAPLPCQLRTLAAAEGLCTTHPAQLCLTPWLATPICSQGQEGEGVSASGGAASDGTAAQRRGQIP